MKRIGASKVSRKFRELLAAAKAGEIVTITRRGEAVVRVLPVDRAHAKSGAKARARLRKSLASGWPMGGRKPTESERRRSR